MQYHSNAKTNIKQRELIKNNRRKSNRELAKDLCISHTTVNNWAKREDAKDKSCRPHKVNYALSKQEERIIIKLRDKLLLSLDAILDALNPYIENLNRTNCYRVLLRNRRNVLSKKEKRKYKEFKSYDPGFIHIDIFDLPKIEGKKWFCFLAVDRATRLVFLEAYPNKTKESASDFLIKCLKFYPFAIKIILTDNGRQFTMKGQQSFGRKSTTGTLFEIICEIAGIEYRKTKAYHPWTNGMAERMVRTVKEHTLQREKYNTINICNKALKGFQSFHNYYRKIRVINKKSPYEKLIYYYNLEPNTFFLDPTEWKQCGETLQL